VTGVWRGRALAGVLRQSDQSEKTWLCCYREPTSPGTESVYRQLLPGLLLWQPSQWKEEARGRSPCFVWKLSQWNVACRIWRQWQPQNMVDLSSSGVGNSKHTASLSYHAPWFELSPGLCATWVWNSPSRTGPLHVTVVHELSWIQGRTLNTKCHGLIIAVGGKMSIVIFSIPNSTRWEVIFWNALYNPGLQGSVRHSTFKLISF
jgi:hypothetical protein